MSIMDPRQNKGWLQAIWARIVGTTDPVQVVADAQGRLIVSAGVAQSVDVTVQVNGADASPTNPLPTTDDYSIEIVVQPTITAGPYTAGDALGGRIELPYAVLEQGGSGVITKITVVDDANQRVPMDFVFFNQAFTATVDNAPFAPSVADLENCLGFVDFLGTDYSQFTANAVGSKASGTRMPFEFSLAAANMTLYGQAVNRGTPTFVGVNNLTFKFEIRRKCE